MAFIGRNVKRYSLLGFLLLLLLLSFFLFLFFFPGIHVYTMCYSMPYNLGFILLIFAAISSSILPWFKQMWCLLCVECPLFSLFEYKNVTQSIVLQSNTLFYPVIISNFLLSSVLKFLLLASYFWSFVFTVIDCKLISPTDES